MIKCCELSQIRRTRFPGDLNQQRGEKGQEVYFNGWHPWASTHLQGPSYLNRLPQSIPHHYVSPTLCILARIQAPLQV